MSTSSCPTFFVCIAINVNGVFKMLYLSWFFSPRVRMMICCSVCDGAAGSFILSVSEESVSCWDRRWKKRCTLAFALLTYSVVFESNVWSRLLMFGSFERMEDEEETNSKTLEVLVKSIFLFLDEGGAGVTTWSMRLLFLLLRVFLILKGVIICMLL